MTCNEHNNFDYYPYETSINTAIWNLEGLRIQLKSCVHKKDDYMEILNSTRTALQKIEVLLKNE